MQSLQQSICHKLPLMYTRNYPIWIWLQHFQDKIKNVQWCRIFGPRYRALAMISSLKLNKLKSYWKLHLSTFMSVLRTFTFLDGFFQSIKIIQSLIFN